MSDYVQHNCNVVRFSSADSWVILTEIGQRIKEKIESIGTPLKDWNIQINYGIKTGLNDAFVISTEKRDEILEKCTSEDERNRTADIIRPFWAGFLLGMIMTSSGWLPNSAVKRRNSLTLYLKSEGVF